MINYYNSFSSLYWARGGQSNQSLSVRSATFIHPVPAFADDNLLYAATSRTPTPAPADDNYLLRDTLAAMAQLGLYGLGSTVALSVEAAEIAQAARTAGQPQLAQRVDAMSSAALQTSRNLQFLTMRGVVPTTNRAAADGSITMAPLITRNYSADTVAQTLNLSTLRDADADVLERYYKSMTRKIPQAAHESFVTNALAAPWTKEHPLAAQTATSLTAAMGATMPNVEGGRKRS